MPLFFNSTIVFRKALRYFEYTGLEKWLTPLQLTHPSDQYASVVEDNFMSDTEIDV